MKVLRSQRGVAMVTVLFIGAAMTVVASAGAFTTIREFRAGSDDRKASEAITIAEAGVDRFLNHLKSGLVTFGDLNSAGCGSDPPIAIPDGAVGNGTYTASLTVYTPPEEGAAAKFPPEACDDRPTSPHPGMGDDLTYFVITSEGRHPDANRTIQQVIALKPIGLPIGIYARAVTVQSAQHPFRTVSMVSETTINNRDNLAFGGDDAYYKVGDFFSVATGKALTDPVPTGAHAASGILLKQSTSHEFANDHHVNCNANNSADGANPKQSIWDSDGSLYSGDITIPLPEEGSANSATNCTGVTAYPHSSTFLPSQLSAFAKPDLSTEDHAVLAEAARVNGIYCSFAGTPPNAGDSALNDYCYREGVLMAAAPANYAPALGPLDYKGHVQDVKTRKNSFIAYFDYRGGSVTNNNIGRTGEVWSCHTDPSKSIVVIVRNGGVNYTGAEGDKINGAFIIDGNFQVVGGFEFNGTIIAGGTVHFHSSSQLFTMDSCWVENMPGPFFQTVPGHWSEIDR